MDKEGDCVYKQFNANPVARRGDDCTVRAIATALGKSWDEIYIELCLYGLMYHDMPSSNHVWGEYLIKNGYTRHMVPTRCTVKEFSQDHDKGVYILALHGHVVALIDGDYYDSWDSGDEIPLYYWWKEKK